MSEAKQPNLRPATIEEATNFFLHVCKTIYGDGPSPQLLDWEALRNCDEFFVAEWDGEAVGIATLAGLTSRRPPTLDRIYVVPEHRGKGIGLCLCATAIRRFKERQKTLIYCDVSSRNMHRTVERLPPELKTLLNLNLSYQDYGDEWENHL